MKVEKWLKTNAKSLVGKKIAISGSTGGIGKETCELLANLGASLVLIDRNRERSLKNAEKIRFRHPQIDVSHVFADMEDMDSVEKAADELSGMDIDILILNAGAYAIPRHKCSTGYGNVFQINFISPYFLARRLLPSLSKRDGKIIAVGSIAHRYSKTDMGDVDFSSRTRASLVYGNAKRYLMFSLAELALREGFSKNVVIAHPGITFTNITAHYPKLIYALIKHPMKVIFMKPKVACLSIIAGIFTSAEGLSWIGPSVFDVWGIPKTKKLKSASDEERKAIFSVAEKIYAENS